METEMYRLTYLSEEALWWYFGMDQLTELLIEQDHHLHRLEVLDAGCGTGGMMKQLARYGRVTGFDLSPVALEFCRERQLTRLARASTTALPFRSNSFDLVTSFDVLTSIPVTAHAGIFDEFARVLKPGGHVLVRAAAYDWIRGGHDRASHVVYRYRRSQLTRALQAAGFLVERSTYANAFLLPVAIAKRIWEARHGQPERTEVRSDFWMPPALLNRAMAGVLHFENLLIRRRVTLPVGLSVVAIARLAGRE